MGDTHHDPTDHSRTTQPHAGITMKDNFFWPGLILLAVAVSGMISTVAAAAYRHYEWLATTGLVAVLGTVAGALWFVMERRRVTRIDEAGGTPHTPIVGRTGVTCAYRRIQGLRLRRGLPNVGSLAGTASANHLLRAHSATRPRRYAVEGPQP